jgi:hypothetical protein
MQRLIKLTVSHLFEDVRIPGLINLEGFTAMWAIDFLHFQLQNIGSRSTIRQIHLEPMDAQTVAHVSL